MIALLPTALATIIMLAGETVGTLVPKPGWLQKDPDEDGPQERSYFYGNIVTPGQFPFFVWITIRKQSQTASGTILSKRYVLTYATWLGVDYYLNRSGRGQQYGKNFKNNWQREAKQDHHNTTSPPRLNRLERKFPDGAKVWCGIFHASPTMKEIPEHKGMKIYVADILYTHAHPTMTRIKGFQLYVIETREDIQFTDWIQPVKMPIIGDGVFTYPNSRFVTVGFSKSADPESNLFSLQFMRMNLIKQKPGKGDQFLYKADSTTLENVTCLHGSGSAVLGNDMTGQLTLMAVSALQVCRKKINEVFLIPIKPFLSTFMDLYLPENDIVHDLITAGRSIRSSSTLGPSHRVYSDFDAREFQYPYMAHIKDTLNPEKELCGGSILNTQWVITAAHCFFGVKEKQLIKRPASDFAVLMKETAASDPRQIRSPILWIVEHPEFASYFLQSANHAERRDIALVELSSHLKFDAWLQPVPLPDQFHSPVQETGTFFKVAGWGTSGTPRRTSSKLRSIFLVTRQMEMCEHYALMSCATALADRKRLTTPQYSEGFVTQGDSGTGLVADPANNVYPALFGVFTTIHEFEKTQGSFSNFIDLFTNLLDYHALVGRRRRRAVTTESTSQSSSDPGANNTVLQYAMFLKIQDFELWIRNTIDFHPVREPDAKEIQRWNLRRGYSVTPGQFPHQALLDFNPSFMTMGSIINSRFVLTSAYAFAGTKGWDSINGTLWFGVFHWRYRTNYENEKQLGYQRRGVSMIDLDDACLIAIVKTDKKIEFNDWIMPITIARPNYSFKTDPINRFVTFGYSTMDALEVKRSDSLNFITLQQMKNGTCPSPFVCAEPKETNSTRCLGDTGAAVLGEINNTMALIGVLQGTNCYHLPENPNEYFIIPIAPIYEWIRMKTINQSMEGEKTNLPFQLQLPQINCTGSTPQIPRSEPLLYRESRETAPRECRDPRRKDARLAGRRIQRKPSQRIVSGLPAQEFQFPYTVSVVAKQTTIHYLGAGSLISSRWVLTVKRVFFFASEHGKILVDHDFLIALGGTSLEEDASLQPRRTFRTVDVHATRSELCLVRMALGMNFSEWIVPIPLISKLENRLPNDALLTIAAYGAINWYDDMFPKYQHFGILTVDTSCSSQFYMCGKSVSRLGYSRPAKFDHGAGVVGLSPSSMFPMLMGILDVAQVSEPQEKIPFLPLSDHIDWIEETIRDDRNSNFTEFIKQEEQLEPLPVWNRGLVKHGK